METFLGKLGWAVLVAAGGFVVWALKGLVAVIIDNRDKLKASYLKDIEQDKDIKEIKAVVKIQDVKIDKNKDDITKIITTHNNSCASYPILP